MNVIAGIAARNEELYMEQCIKHLIQQGIQVAVINHGSTDRTLEICQNYYPEHVIMIKTLPFTGEYDHEKMLLAKEEVRLSLKPDWYIHHDTDEIMESDVKGELLIDAICRVDQAGYNIINFDEFVFVYESNSISYENVDYFQHMKHYYFFEPRPYRLMRAFKCEPGISNVAKAGHEVIADTKKIYPNNFQLRHYISLSHSHAVRKYVNRKFAKRNLDKGWHGNRVGIREAMLSAPPKDKLNCISTIQGNLDTSYPYLKHFWEW